MSEYTKRAREFAHKAAEHVVELDHDPHFVDRCKPLRQTVGDLVDAIHLLADEIERLDRDHTWAAEQINGIKKEVSV